MTDPYEASRRQFNTYAGTTGTPAHPMSALQVRLARWQNIKFGAADPRDIALGVGEEVGELADGLITILDTMLTTLKLAAGSGRAQHAVLKQHQRIRGMDDTEAARRAVADAIGDVLIFSIQLATLFRLDVWELLRHTAEQVMAREGATPDLETSE